MRRLERFEFNLGSHKGRPSTSTYWRPQVPGVQYLKMSITLWLGIIAGLLVSVGSALAGHLAAKTRWHKWVFWGTGFTAVVLIGFQSYLNENAQGELARKIDRINDNTQVALHTNLDILPPYPVTADPYFPFLSGHSPNVAMMFVNSGSQPANDTMLSLGLNVVPYPLSEDAEREVWKESSLHGSVTAGGTLLPHSPGHYNSVAAAPLTATEAKQLTSGELQLCTTARVIWTDKTGGYCRYSFQCFHREPGIYHAQAFFNWHVQGIEYNREEPCTIQGLGH